MITLVGGGGKTSLMYHLLTQLKCSGHTAVAAATTKLAARPWPGSRFVVVRSLEAAVDAVGRALTASEHLTLVSGPDEADPEKMRGIPPAWIDALAAAFPDTFLVVEGDGSAGKPLKGHLAHEPVVPLSTRLLAPVIGVDALGAPLDAGHVHRPQRIVELTGARPGSPVTNEIIVDLLFHPEGYLQHCPDSCLVLPFINKVETPERRRQAEELAAMILAARRPQVCGVLLGSVQEDAFWCVEAEPKKTPKPIVGVILAAGGSKRMGRPKLLLPLGGKALIRHVADEACRSELQQVTVVTGAYAAQVEEALAGLPVRIVHNELWADGQSTSVRKAVESLPDGRGAVMFLLADQPFVDSTLINALIDTYRQTAASIVAPVWRQRRGNPVLFDLATWRDELLRLTGDEGARRIVAANETAVRQLEMTDGDVFFDADTPEDYERLQELWADRAAGK